MLNSGLYSSRGIFGGQSNWLFKSACYLLPKDISRDKSQFVLMEDEIMDNQNLALQSFSA